MLFFLLAFKFLLSFLPKPSCDGGRRKFSLISSMNSTNILEDDEYDPNVETQL